MTLSLIVSGVRLEPPEKPKIVFVGRVPVGAGFLQADKIVDRSDEKRKIRDLDLPRPAP